MKKRIFLVLGLVLLVSILAPFTVFAQDPGSGGVIIEANSRGSSNLGPLIPFQCNGVDCANIFYMLYPGLVYVDPATQYYVIEDGVVQGGKDALAVAISSEDGLTYNVQLRDDAVWNDGTPITAVDIMFAYEASEQGEAAGVTGDNQSPGIYIDSVEVVDDYNMIFHMSPDAACEALRYIGYLYAVPAHAFGYSLGQEDFDWGSLVEHPFRSDPQVTGGMFQFNRTEPGTAVYLDFNPNYYDGVTIPEGWIFLDVPDEAVMVERFLAGGADNPNFIREPNGGAIITTLKEAAAEGKAQTVALPGNIWHYVSINHADPENPADGLDENGNPIDQGHHPFFGDVRVRQALQHAINIDDIIAGPLGGNAVPMVGSTISNAWTFDPNSKRRPYDLDAARALLDEAGFPATGEPLVEGGDGLRIANEDALYAEPGTEFYIEILNPGGVRNDVSVILQDEFAKIGIKADVVALDFNTMYGDNMGVQTYDLAVAGWRGSIPFDPDQRSLIGRAADVEDPEGYGNNFGSYYNAEFEELSAKMQTLPGCDQAERAAIAHQIQAILWEDQPYLWLYQLESTYATLPNVENFEPYVGFGAWNGNAWHLVQE